MEEFHVHILCQGDAENLWQARVPKDVIPLPIQNHVAISPDLASILDWSHWTNLSYLLLFCCLKADPLAHHLERHERHTADAHIRAHMNLPRNTSAIAGWQGKTLQQLACPIICHCHAIQH